MKRREWSRQGPVSSRMQWTLEMVKAWDQVFFKLKRRYKYLEEMLPEEMKKILVISEDPLRNNVQDCLK